MINPKEDLKKKLQTAAWAGWIIGCFVIFLVASVTYRYVGLEGDTWFQVHGIMVAIIIAHYSHRVFKLNKDTEDDIQE